MRDYTKIDAWKLADDLAVVVYERTRKFPREELYGLTSQLRRAVVSVAANIAEGASRESKRDYLHFLYISRGSLGETRYYIHLARRLGYLAPQDEETLATAASSTFARLHGLILAVEKEAGTVRKLVAAATSALCLLLVHGPRPMFFSSGP
jgi:four helix bundle protein